MGKGKQERKMTELGGPETRDQLACTPATVINERKRMTDEVLVEREEGGEKNS